MTAEDFPARVSAEEAAVIEQAQRRVPDGNAGGKREPLKPERT
jgi:hypothetical protein